MKQIIVYIKISFNYYLILHILYIKQVKQVKELREETADLKNIIQRLNIELNVYQVKYPPQIMKKENEPTFLNQNQQSQVNFK